MAATPSAMTTAFANHQTQSTTPPYLLSKKQILLKAEAGARDVIRAKAEELDCMLLAAVGYFESRFGFENDSAKGNEWLIKLSKRDSTPAGLCAIGFSYQRPAGQVDEQDVMRAKEQYSAMVTNHIPSKYLYAAIFKEFPYEDDNQKISLTKDTIDSLRLGVVDCVAAKFSPAMFLLGRLYLNGEWGFEQNIEEGLRLIEEAALKGDGPAQSFLGQVYSKGQFNQRKDLTEAKKWFKIAKSQGVSLGTEEFDLCKGGCSIQ